MTRRQLAHAMEALGALRTALATEEEAAILLAGARLRVALVEIGTCDVPAAAQELVAAATLALRGVSNQVRGLVAERQLRARSNTISIESYRRPLDGVVDASGEIIEAATIKERSLARMILAGAYVRDVFAPEAMLDDLDASLGMLVRVRIGAGSMRGARLEGSLIEQSDFARANLDRSNWLGATAFGSSLAGSVLTDTCLGDALFVECDLRGADLRSISLRAEGMLVGARFARCDLRETNWDGRDLQGASLIDCKLHGAHGSPAVDGVWISRPDLSLLGDGSRIGTQRDVIDRWKRS